MMALTHEEATPTATQPAASSTTASSSAGIMETSVPTIQHQHEVAMPIAAQPTPPNTNVSNAVSGVETAVPTIRSPRPEIARGVKSSRDRPRISKAAISPSDSNAVAPSTIAEKRERESFYIGTGLVADIEDEDNEWVLQKPRVHPPRNDERGKAEVRE